MGQNVPGTVPAFSYAGLNSTADRLDCLKIEEGKSARVAFLKDIPGMQNPPFVFCKVHWNSEMGDNGRMYQCFGGQCCQQITWQKGWGGASGKFDAHKARNRYYIPVIHYCPDPSNPAVSIASVKYMDMTWTAFDALVKTIRNTTEGLDFFDRDITLEVRKVNGATDYLYTKGETQAQWQVNPVFKQQVESQLPEVATKLAAAMPQVITESEFMEMKPQLDAKVNASMQSHNAAQQSQQQQPQASPYGAFPTAQPMQAVYQQPAAQPVYPQPEAQPYAAAQPNVGVGLQQTPQFTQPTVNIPTQAVTTQQVPAQQAVAAAPVEQTPTVELQKVNLDFDPNTLLNS